MFPKVFLLGHIVFSAVILAEVQQGNLQVERNLEGYLPSGWRPLGHNFQLPESNQFVYKAPTQESLSYLPPQTNGQHTQADDAFIQFQESSAPEFQFNRRLSNSQSNGPIGEQIGKETQVDSTYSSPRETLAAPPNQPPVTYGPPLEEITTTTSVPLTTEESTTTELPTTTENVFAEIANKSLNNDQHQQKENLMDATKESGAGIYYIYHPTGLLQKVSYLTKDDQINMAYTAQLKYENVEPIRSPVYTYDPETYVFKRLQ